MSEGPKKPAGSYEVGYGKPPVATRFQKGQSGNPKGRPKRTGPADIEDLFMKEYLRPVKVREGDRIQTMPAIQVILRAEINKGVKGSGPAQRNVLRTARQIGSGWQARHEALLQAAIELQVAVERDLARAEREGRPGDRTVLDRQAVKVNVATGEVRLCLPDGVADEDD